MKRVSENLDGKKLWILSFIILMIFQNLCQDDLFAQNGMRKGFILGIGVGPGFIKYRGEYENFGLISIGEEKSRLTVMSDFKIGYAPNDNLAIYWMSKVSWFNRETSFDKELTISGVAGLGASYYLNSEFPSLYFNGGVGYSTWGTLDFPQGNSTYLGLGFVIGAGYEFAKHFSVEGNISWGRPNEDFFSYNVYAFRITLNYLLY